MNEDEWFKAIQDKVNELHNLTHEAPGTMNPRANYTAGVLEATVEVLSYLTSCFGWERHDLLPYDRREIEAKWKNNVSWRLK